MHEVYELTSAKLFGICLRILGTREEAEDVLQEVYLTVWHRADTFDAAKASPISWLAAIARNKAIDRARSLKSRVVERPVDEGLEVQDGRMDALARLEWTEDHRRLRGCLDGLEPHARDAITDAFFGGHTYEELARRGGRPLGTVKSWIRRGLLSLRECLEI